jgi:hypothetical protein
MLKKFFTTELVLKAGEWLSISKKISENKYEFGIDHAGSKCILKSQTHRKVGTESHGSWN